MSAVTLSLELAAARTARFGEMVAQAQACRRCPRMEGRTRAIGPANGPLDAAVLFVAEAPGRLGADRTGIPLSGDQTGRNFERLLASGGIDRRGIFNTNAVLCNPRSPDGRNDRPRTQEIRNCSEHLRAVIGLLAPPMVVSLGRAALDALAQIEPHGCELARDVGRPVHWYGRQLVPLYHPGARAMIRRTFTQQTADYAALARLLGGLACAVNRVAPAPPPRPVECVGLCAGEGEQTGRRTAGILSRSAAPARPLLTLDS